MPCHQLLPLIYVLKKFDVVLLQLKLMQKQNLKPHDSTLAAVAISCSNALELDLAEELLGQISGSPHPYPINACLEACNALVRCHFSSQFFLFSFFVSYYFILSF